MSVLPKHSAVGHSASCDPTFGLMNYKRSASPVHTITNKSSLIAFYCYT